LQSRLIEMAQRCAEAVYPEEARRQGLQGTATLQLDFDAQGRLAGTTVEKSTGSALLDERAVWLAGQVPLQPPTQMTGRAFSVSLPLAFRLQNCADGSQPPCTAAAQPPSSGDPAGDAQR
jgi:TonB family protein